MSSLNRQAVLECLSRLVTPGIKFIALADELGVRKHEYNGLKKIITDLVEEGTAQQLPGGAYKLSPSTRAADRKTAPKPKEVREEYDPPDEPFAASAAPPNAKPAKVAPKKGALPWGGKPAAKVGAPVKKPRPPSGKIPKIVSVSTLFLAAKCLKRGTGRKDKMMGGKMMGQGGRRDYEQRKIQEEINHTY